MDKPVKDRCADCFISSGEYKYLCNEQSCRIAYNKRRYSSAQVVMGSKDFNVHPAVRATNKVMMSLPYMGDKTKTYAYAQAIATALTKESNDDTTNC